MPTKLNWTLVDTVAKSIAPGLNLRSAREAFPALVLSRLLGITYEEAADAITDGANDRGIDALFFDDDQSTLHLFNFKYYDDYSKSDSWFPGTEIEKVVGFIDSLIALDGGLTQTCNRLLAGKVQDLWDKITAPHFMIRAYFASNGRELNTNDRARFTSHFAKHRFIQIHEMSVDDIAEQMIRATDERVDGQMQLTANQYFPRIDGKTRGLIATVNAIDLIKLLADPKAPQKINRAAFNENIRLYLGNKNEVNRSILQTALGTENREFWYLNNGITIVCEKFIYNDVAGPIVELTNLQIVNGGQTANALFEAYLHNEAKLKNVFLLARIYEASGGDIKLKIASATNNQTRINSRDLKSNDPIQKRLEEGLVALGYFYERKKDQHQFKPVYLRIDALRAGQTYLAYYEQEPDKAKTQSNRIFGEWYDRIFNDEITPVRLLCPVRLAKEIELRKLGVKREIRSGLASDVDDEFLIEGSFHVLYVVGRLCALNSINLEDFEAAKTHVDEAIGLTRRVAQKFRGKSYYKFFRSIEAKDILFKTIYKIKEEKDEERLL